MREEEAQPIILIVVANQKERIKMKAILLATALMLGVSGVSAAEPIAKVIPTMVNGKASYKIVIEGDIAYEIAKSLDFRKGESISCAGVEIEGVEWRWDCTLLIDAKSGKALSQEN